jgi:DNA-binding response OmpR family regulator
MRRKRLTVGARLVVRDLSLDRATHMVEYNGRSVELSAREFRVLEVLALHEGKSIHCDFIYKRVWKVPDPDMPAEPEVIVRSVLAPLRRKLTLIGAGDLIETMPGEGYRLALPPRAP